MKGLQVAALEQRNVCSRSCSRATFAALFASFTEAPVFSRPFAVKSNVTLCFLLLYFCSCLGGRREAWRAPSVRPTGTQARLPRRAPASVGAPQDGARTSSASQGKRRCRRSQTQRASGQAAEQPQPLSPGHGRCLTVLPSPAMTRKSWSGAPLLCLCLCCLWLVRAEGSGRAEQERPRERRGSQSLLGSERGEGQRAHLGAVGSLSGRAWRMLACRFWQEEEEEECQEQEEGSLQQPPGWSLPIMSEIVSKWYCKFGRCCPTGDCRVINNITGLELDLSRRLHGQHLAKYVVLKAVQGFLETPQPEKALALSFHGWSGTGKNFVARLIAEHLYQDGLKSECVKVFISLFHFPYPKYVDIYKVQLAKQISETVQLCQQSLFIFDEVEKLQAGLLDVIKPYVDHYDSLDTVDYRQSIFLFLSNTGGNVINEVVLDFWRAGRAREEITMEYLEGYLRAELLESADEGYAHTRLLEENLIDFLVPFLPLEYRHVKLCARDAFLARGVQFTEEVLDEVARMMVFVPKEEKLFSAQGCKSVSQRINYFLP